MESVQTETQQERDRQTRLERRRQQEQERRARETPEERDRRRSLRNQRDQERRRARCAARCASALAQLERVCTCIIIRIRIYIRELAGSSTRPTVKLWCSGVNVSLILDRQPYEVYLSRSPRCPALPYCSLYGTWRNVLQSWIMYCHAANIFARSSDAHVVR